MPQCCVGSSPPPWAGAPSTVHECSRTLSPCPPPRVVFFVATLIYGSNSGLPCLFFLYHTCGLFYLHSRAARTATALRTSSLLFWWSCRQIFTHPECCGVCAASACFVVRIQSRRWSIFATDAEAPSTVSSCRTWTATSEGAGVTVARPASSCDTSLRHRIRLFVIYSVPCWRCPLGGEGLLPRKQDATCG